jgi:YidC/Oxa1 family membrane protein insertase
MDERRLLLAVALSFLVLSFYPLLVPSARRGGPTPAAVNDAASPATPTASSTSSPEAATVSPGAPTAVPEHADSRERRVDIETPFASIGFTNKGARLLSWRLRQYLDARGRPEEMVVVQPEGVRALDVLTGDREADAALKDALFEVSTEEVKVREGAEESITFRYGAGSLAITKEFTFSGREPLARLRLSIQREGRELERSLVWGPGLGLRAVPGDVPQAVTLVSRSAERVAPAKLKKERRTYDSPRWIGVETRYFAALLVSPDDARGSRGEAHAIEVRTPAGEMESQVVAELHMGESSAPVTLYVGPKDHFLLSRLGHDLRAVVPVGDWLGPIVVPLMALLRWVNRYIGNYGWSIVVLTVLINLVMGPFRHFSIVNGLKMARISPEMRTIQERYRRIPMLDPRRQEMQNEIGALYARHGMSMGGQMALGCLPMLLTMPFLIAFYQVLQVSIELRGAPFLWISDLSQKDPLYLTPILMSISMFLMQRMMPSAMDPAQQRIMMLMPVVFGVMFFAAPAGLNLYWLASNLCSMAQQGVTKALYHHPSEKAHRR